MKKANDGLPEGGTWCKVWSVLKRGGIEGGEEGTRWGLGRSAKTGVGKKSSEKCRRTCKNSEREPRPTTTGAVGKGRL